MKNIVRWLSGARVLLWPVYWATGIVRRDPRLWVFSSRHGHTFTDNAKWLFLRCRTDPRVRAVWLTRSRPLANALRDRGMEAYYLFSVRGLWCSVRAGLYLFDNSAGALNLWLSRGARLVNLWHGVPLKKIEADMPRTSRYYRHHPRWSWRGLFQTVFQPYKAFRHDYLIATSDAIGAILAGAFRMAPSRVLVTGYPRNDPLFAIGTERASEGELLDSLSVASYQRILAYMPTFREYPTGDEHSWDWHKVDRELAARNALLLIKLHPTDVRKIGGPGFTNIKCLPADVDPYPILRKVDALITDYSSIYFDYLLLDRPVLFFPYDLEHYERDERGLYFSYEEVTPGARATSFEQLIAHVNATLDRYEDERDAWRAERDRVVALCHRYRDGSSSERVIQALLERAVGGADVPPSARPR